MPGQFPAAIANEFIRREGFHVNQMRLHKLVYIAHGWTLAVTGEPLVIEQPQAWDNGPVFRSIWDAIRYDRTGEHGVLLDTFEREPFQANLTETETAVIDHVWNKYSGYTGRDLSEMTHQTDTPWYKAYFERHRNSPLRDAEVREHFIALAMAGRDQEA